MYLESLISQNHFNTFECLLTFRQSKTILSRNNVGKVSEKHFFIKKIFNKNILFLL